MPQLSDQIINIIKTDYNIKRKNFDNYNYVLEYIKKNGGAEKTETKTNATAQ